MRSTYSSARSYSLSCISPKMTCSLLVNSCVYARSASKICCTPVKSCASRVTSVRLRKIATAPSIWIVPPQRNAVRNHRDVCDGFQADVVFGLSRPHDASYSRARINHLERLSNRLVNTDAAACLMPRGSSTPPCCFCQLQECPRPVRPKYPSAAETDGGSRSAHSRANRP